MLKQKRNRIEEIKLQKVLRSMLEAQEGSKVLDICFQEQLDFIKDPSELKAALCTRRSGKTTGAAVYLISEALNHPGINCIYIGITKGTAKKTLITGGADEAILVKLIEQLKIKAEVNLTEGSIRFSNGSVIWVTGTDATPEEARKLYGTKYKLAIIDEAGSHRQDLRDLIYMKLRPAMAQEDSTSGTVALIGTPENNRGFFFRVTGGFEVPEKDRVPGWSIHSWSYESNPYQKDAVNKQIQELKSLYPGITSNPKHEFYPLFQQHYLGKWVMDRNAMVYAYQPEVNTISQLPSTGNWTYCAGVDFGFIDAATIVTVAYREHDPTLYVVEAFKQSYLDRSDFALEIVRRKEHPGVSRFIADHDPATVADIHSRFGVYLEQAEKTSKIDFIGIMNAEWLRGRIKVVVSSDTEKLVKELEELVWDKKALMQGIKKEDPSLDNHCCDALLYVWRSLFQYLAKPNIGETKDPLNVYSALLRKETIKKLKAKMEKKTNQPWKQHRIKI